MKYSVLFIGILLSVTFSLQGQMSSVKINVTSATYINNSVEQKMEKWLQKDPSESTRDYEKRTSEVNKRAVRKQFEAEASAKYKELLKNNANGSELPVLNNNSALPVIHWLSPTLSSSETHIKDLKVQACITSESQIKSVSVAVNNRISRGVSAIQNDGCDLSLSQTIVLAKGMNTIKIMVENQAGQTVSDTRYVNYQTSNPYQRTDVTQEQPNEVQAPDKRLALVIGNAAYRISPLANPVNDAADVAAKLKKLGFEVIMQKNETKEQMDRAIDDFGRQAKGYDVALFFYAGHALQYNGKNYLIPVNASLQEERDIEYNCTPIDRALGRMEDSNAKLKIVLLDACRNNPFERSWRSFNGNGLSFMNAPAGTFIAYSTAPNTVAQDGKGRNSPYTTELLKKLDVKHLKIEDLFKQVREAVMKRTNGQQVPWDQSSITGEFYFNF